MTQNTDAKLVEKFSQIFDEITQKDQPGFLKVLDRRDLLTATEQVANTIKKKFDTLVVLGIGGSSLGAKTIINAFGLQKRVVFFENVDAMSMKMQMKNFDDLKRVHWVVVSKSGKTLETIAQLHLIEQRIAPLNVTINDHFTVISEKTKNPLTDWATANQIPILEIPLDLGGRFSVLSPVGMFPVLFAGLNANNFIAGAQEVLKNKKLFTDFCSQIAQSYNDKKYITILWTYSDLLNTFGLWYQQLWAESLGKQKTLDNKPAPRASTPMPLIGSNDQHSVLQQVSEAEKDKFVIFLRLKQAEMAGDTITSLIVNGFEYLKGKKLGDILRAQAEGTQAALKENGVPSMVLSAEHLDEKNLGSLFLFFELAVAMLGKYHNINPYDQPGVELSKKMASDILKSSLS